MSHLQGELRIGNYCHRGISADQGKKVTETKNLSLLPESWPWGASVFLATILHTWLGLKTQHCGCCHTGWKQIVWSNGICCDAPDLKYTDTLNRIRFSLPPLIFMPEFMAFLLAALDEKDNFPTLLHNYWSNALMNTWFSGVRLPVVTGINGARFT